MKAGGILVPHLGGIVVLGENVVFAQTLSKPCAAANGRIRMKPPRKVWKFCEDFEFFLDFLVFDHFSLHWAPKRG